MKAGVIANGGAFVEFSQLPQALQDEVNTACVTTWVEYAKMLEDSGTPGAKICKLWRDCMVENGAVVIDGVDEALEELLETYG